MKCTPYHASLANRPRHEIPPPPYKDVYPVVLSDGSQVDLPIEPLPGCDQAIVLLMSNQTPFVVEQKLAQLLTEAVKSLAPEVVVGIPTMGLDYARLVAANLGLPHYVALGNSRKFWYRDELSIPVSSVTSPGMAKKLYLDPALVSRIEGKRTLIVDDVIATGGSSSAAVNLLQRINANIVGLAFVFSEGAPWKKVLAALDPDLPNRVHVIGEIPRLGKTAEGWVPLTQF
jgi:adenine/guanine phosphoribosyltransferase-like PRPP-binding protein